MSPTRAGTRLALPPGMKTLSCTLLSTTLLLALGGSLGCATTGGVAEQPRYDAPRDDAKITQELSDRFAASVAVDRRRIDIDTYAGHVKLAGFVDDVSQARAAERITLETAGVVSVANEIIVDPDFRGDLEDAGEGWDDYWIEEMVYYKLGAASAVERSDVAVEVEDGIVELSGMVDTMEARVEAHTLAGSVDGVVSVVNVLTVAEFQRDRAN